MTTKVKRRLTTLLCADLEGYTRLMGADEAGTLATLQRYRAAMATLIERHDGRIVNTWGDAVIAEFASVVARLHFYDDVNHIWFQWPVAVLLLIAFLSAKRP